MTDMTWMFPDRSTSGKTLLIPKGAETEVDTHTPAEFFRRLEAIPMPPSAFAARSGFSDQRPLQRWKSGAKTIPKWAWAQLDDLEQIKRLKQRARRRGIRAAAETVTEGEALEDWFQRLSEL